jgi:uncharacterized membrane protein YphA (DoxX/SURF4 family)
MNIFIFLRIILGCFFIVSAMGKLTEPYQNFLYVTQSYEIFPLFLETIIARTIPWLEFFVGLFVLLGLWLKISLRVLGGLLICFLVIVGQALIRNLDITDCGCFGEFLTVPLYVVFLFDMTLLFLTILMLKNYEKTSVKSLDQYF